jgi:hypothetical protein
MRSSGPWARKGYLVEQRPSGSGIDPTVYSLFEALRAEKATTGATDLSEPDVDRAMTRPRGAPTPQQMSAENPRESFRDNRNFPRAWGQTYCEKVGDTRAA